jgi:hypothetical protein
MYSVASRLSISGPHRREEGVQIRLADLLWYERNLFDIELPALENGTGTVVIIANAPEGQVVQHAT